MPTASEVIEETLRHWNDAIRPDILGEMELHDSILSALDKAGKVVVDKELLESFAEILPYAEDYWDEGPGDEGWQSVELMKKVERAQRLLLSAHAKEEAQ